jgi:hypothetical protein
VEGFVRLEFLGKYGHISVDMGVCLPLSYYRHQSGRKEHLKLSLLHTELSPFSGVDIIVGKCKHAPARDRSSRHHRYRHHWEDSYPTEEVDGLQGRKLLVLVLHIGDTLQVETSAEQLGKRDCDEAGGSLMLLDDIELAMDVSDEGPSEGVGFGVEEQEEDAAFLLENGGVVEIYGGDAQSGYHSISHR